MTATASNLPSSAVPTHDTATIRRPAHDPDRAVPVDPSTLAELSVDVANDVLSAHRGRWPELDAVSYVAHPEPADCTRARVCHPLPAPTPAGSASPPHRPGHLHHDGYVNLGDANAVRMPAVLALLADLIAAGVARDLLDCQAVAERRRADQLESALESNRTIGMAIGVLIALRQLSPEQAFTELRTTSQNHNRKLRDVAGDVVRTGTLPPAQPRAAGTTSAPPHGDR